MNFFRLLPFACAIVAGLVATEAAYAQNGISMNSPFLPPSGSGPVAPVTENSPLELRGIMDSANGYIFGLFDPVKRKAAWVKLNEDGQDFTVRAHDVANNSVTVEYQGRTMTLAMKVPKIETVAHLEVPPMPNMAEQPQVQAPAADEERRLERVAAEVRRRRAQRQSAAQRQQQQRTK